MHHGPLKANPLTSTSSATGAGATAHSQNRYARNLLINAQNLEIVGDFEGTEGCLPYNEVTIIYVNQEKTGGTQTGMNWTNAFLHIQDALAIAAAYPNIVEIWVAGATYVPTTDADRVKSYEMVSGVKVMGGFNGVIENISDRTPLSQTIMSGNIGDIELSPDNSYNTAGGQLIMDQTNTVNE